MQFIVIKFIRISMISNLKAILNINSYIEAILSNITF